MPFTMPNFPILTAEQSSPLVSALNAYKSGSEALYTPMTTQSNALSKMAYSNLMGPQFIAKLLGNKEAVANMDNPQELLNLVTSAGIGQTKLGQQIAQLIRSKLPGGSGVGQQPVYNQSSSMGGQTQPAQQSAPQQVPSSQPTLQPDKISQAIKAWYESPQTQQQINDQGYATVPSQDKIMSWQQQQQSAGQPIVDQPQKTNAQIYAENAGVSAGLEKEGEEAGKYRAEDQKEFGKQYENGLSLGDKFKEMGSIITDPEFRNMRKDIQFFQDKQLKLLSKNGTPYQKELIGRFINTGNEVVRDTLNSFTGNRLKSEADISQQMKINDNDTFDVALGKLKAAELYKDLSMERARIASDIMENEHISKMKALQKADKQINGDAIRKQIDKSLDYSVTVREVDNKTGKVIGTKKIPVSEARKLGVPNV